MLKNRFMVEIYRNVQSYKNIILFLTYKIL